MWRIWIEGRVLLFLITNGWPIINGPLLHATFQLLHISYYKNKIHQKMQREKLYNLHRTGNFMVTIFVFKSDKIVSNQISTLRKRCFLNKRPIRFFHISSLFYLIFCIKQKTKYTIRCSVKSSTFYIRRLVLQLQLLC